MLDWFKRAGQEPQDWMWQMYKQALARGPQPPRPEPLSVMARRLGILGPVVTNQIASRGSSPRVAMTPQMPVIAR